MYNDLQNNDFFLDCAIFVVRNFTLSSLAACALWPDFYNSILSFRECVVSDKFTKNSGKTHSHSVKVACRIASCLSVEVSNEAVLFPRRCPRRVRLYWRCPCRDRQTDVMMMTATAISATEEFILRNCCDVWRISDSPVRYVAFDIDKSFTGNHVAKQALLRCLSCPFTG